MAYNYSENQKREAQELLEGAVELETKPDSKYPGLYVRLVRPQGLKAETSAFRLRWQRQCNCGGIEREFYYNPDRGIFFGYCPECGHPYYTYPKRRESRRDSFDHTRNGLKARADWATYGPRTRAIALRGR